MRTAAMGFERVVRLEYGDADGMDGARRVVESGFGDAWMRSVRAETRRFLVVLAWLRRCGRTGRVNED